MLKKLDKNIYFYKSASWLDLDRSVVTARSYEKQQRDFDVELIVFELRRSSFVTKFLTGSKNSKKK